MVVFGIEVKQGDDGVMGLDRMEMDVERDMLWV